MTPRAGGAQETPSQCRVCVDQLPEQAELVALNDGVNLSEATAMVLRFVDRAQQRRIAGDQFPPLLARQIAAIVAELLDAVPEED